MSAIRRNRSGSSSTARSTTSRSCEAELEAKGHAFRTRSDTEVIIHGYKEWGDDVFDRLNGMFGLAHLGRAETQAGRRARRHGHQAGLLPVTNGGSLFFGVGDSRPGARSWRRRPTSIRSR